MKKFALAAAVTLALAAPAAATTSLVGPGAVANLPAPVPTGKPDVAGAVPEPGTWAMLIAGFGLVGAAIRRRRALTA